MKAEVSWLLFIREMNLVRAVKCNEKGFYRQISIKRKTRDNMHLLLTGMGMLVTQSTEKCEVLNASFSSVFTSKSGLQKSLLETIG